MSRFLIYEYIIYVYERMNMTLMIFLLTSTRKRIKNPGVTCQIAVKILTTHHILYGKHQLLD